MYNTLESWAGSMFAFPTTTTSGVSDANNPRILWSQALNLQPNIGIQTWRPAISNLFTTKDPFYYFYPCGPHSWKDFYLAKLHLLCNNLFPHFKNSFRISDLYEITTPMQYTFQSKARKHDIVLSSVWFCLG